MFVLYESILKNEVEEILLVVTLKIPVNMWRLATMLDNADPDQLKSFGSPKLICLHIKSGFLSKKQVKKHNLGFCGPDVKLPRATYRAGSS